MAGSMSVGGTITDLFEISHGLKQGCVLAPTLFTLFLGAVLSASSEHLSMGVFIRTRTEGRLFNLARLRANTKTRELCIRELLFADDAAIVAHTLEDIKEICKHFEQAATLFGLTISTKKTVTLHQPPPGQTSTRPHTEIYGTPLKSVNNFTYLGSTIASENTIDMEINNRIRAASEAFGSEYGHNMALQSPQSARCTRRLYCQHYCTQLRRILSTVATSENFPKCISGIYDKSFGYHGETTFQI